MSCDGDENELLTEADWYLRGMSESSVIIYLAVTSTFTVRETGQKQANKTPQSDVCTSWTIAIKYANRKGDAGYYVSPKKDCFAPPKRAWAHKA